MTVDQIRELGERRGYLLVSQAAHLTSCTRDVPIRLAAGAIRVAAYRGVLKAQKASNDEPKARQGIEGRSQ